VVDSQILNVVTGHSVKGETFHNPGDLFTYCMTSAFARTDGELKYKPGKCQLKFKMRAVATFNKLPGFARISGYKQINTAGPSFLLTMEQMKHIIDRLISTYPELKEIRQEIVQGRDPALHDLQKFKLSIKMTNDATLDDRLILSNMIHAVIENDP
jgi:hypothetical protein